MQIQAIESLYLSSDRAETSEKRSSKPMQRFLFLILTLHIVSFFTLFTKSAGLTQVFKIGIRMTLLLIVIGKFMSMKNQMENHKFEYTRAFPIGFYSLYLLLGFCSLFWSHNVTYSITQWMMTTESLLFTWFYWHIYLFYEVKNPDAPKFEAFFCRAITVVLVWMLVGAWADPDTYFRTTHGGTVARIGGLMMNPNELGMLAGVGMATVYTLWKQSKGLWMGIFAWIICFVVLYMSVSRSSMIGFVLTTGAVVMTSGGFKSRILMLAGVFASLPLVLKYLTMKGDSEELTSGTGRLPFWTDQLTDGLPLEPWFGYGFMRIAYTDKFASLHGYAAGMSHNTFIQVIMNLGIVGISVVLLQMISQFQAILTTSNHALKLLSLMMFVPLFINSISEFGIFGESNYGIFFYQLLILFMTVRVVENKEANLSYKK
jgi:exopolysaccharide production protein ExoQ